MSKTDLPVTLLHKGKTYVNSGARFRGNTSYQRVTNSQKKSFSITLDYEDPKQDLDGYETLHFNNAFEDPSMMREVLYLSFNRRHIPAAKGNFINLYINDQNWGIYPNIQVLNGQFMAEWFLNNDGTRWRAERVGIGTPGAGGGGFGAGTSTLNFLGTDTTVYKSYYTLKNTEKSGAWADLVAACSALNNPVEDDLKKVFDTDRALWFVAHEIIFGDDDSYVAKGGMDYYVFWDSATHRITPIEYDGNTALSNVASSWSPFLKEGDKNFPIMNKLFTVPSLRQRYLAHVRTIIEESLDETYYNNKIDGFYNLIDTFVKNDPKKLYTYDQFVASRTALKNWLKNRKTFLMSNAEVNRVYPEISDVIHTANGSTLSAPNASQKEIVTAKVSSTNGISGVNLYFSTGLDGYFNRTQMFDDGKHGDGAASDGVYGGEIPAYNAGTYVRYYVEALANDAAKTASYMPKGAEHDVYFYQVNLAQLAASEVVINEIMAANTKTVADPKGQFDDWIELYNKSDKEVDISGWFISDNPDKIAKWELPSGTKIPAKGFLIIWADEDSSQNTATSLHANFKLSASAGETIFLSDKTKANVDKVTFGAQQDDISYARKPNGTGNFVASTPTFNKNNDGTLSSIDIAVQSFRIFPNPAATEGVTVEVELSTEARLQVFNTLGQNMFDKKINSGQTHIDTGQWQRGVYVVKIGNAMKKLIVQ
jgi:hypothetical protein